MSSADLENFFNLSLGAKALKIYLAFAVSFNFSHIVLFAFSLASVGPTPYLARMHLNSCCAFRCGRAFYQTKNDLAEVLMAAFPTLRMC